MSYLLELKNWMENTTSTYRDLLPSNFTSTFLPSLSFYYTTDTATNYMKELQVYSVALNLYSEILRRLDKPSENKAAEDTFFHWIPAENPYCTQLIDIESGRRVTVRKSSDGMSLSGCHGDIETNFGRSMGAEAAKMMYDNKLHDEVRQPAK